MSEFSKSSPGKVLVGMSGGADSCVAAMLLLKQGFDVTGATMDTGSASILKDIGDAAKAARILGISHIAIDVKSQFRENVVDYFIAEYEAGRTPNPCVVCNRTVKMGVLMDKALEMGFDFFATGHYARIIYNDNKGSFELHKGASLLKDQSYFLYELTQDRLRHILFPLGEYTKDTVKALAAEYGLVSRDRSESQDICFIPDGDHTSFIRGHSGSGLVPGSFIDSSGRILGRHDGIAKYTVGQRKGIGIAAGHPLFVISKDPAQNTVTLGPEEELYRNEMSVINVNLIDPDEDLTGSRVRVKIRYASGPAEAVISSYENKAAGVIFDTPQKAVAPGQSAVFYDNERVIGGGTII